MEVAGKWHNTSEHGATANCIAINEIQIQGQALTPVDVNGNTSIGTYWNNTTIWGNSNLVDSNSAYGATHSTAFIFTDNAAEIDKYSRVAFSMSYPNIPLITEVYIGNQDYRIPKRITFYYCNSYDKTANLLNRSNEGLSLLGYVDIPENTTDSTKFEVHLREPIQFNGVYLSPIKLSKRISTSKQKSNAGNLKTLTDKVKTQVARKLCLNKMTIRDASHTLKIVDNISNTIRSANESNSIVVSDTKKLIRATRKSIAQNTMALRSNSNAINDFDLKVKATKQYKDKIINIKSVYKLGQELLGSYKFSINGVVITPHSGELSNVSTIDFCISNPQVLSMGSNNCVIEYKFKNGTTQRLEFEIVKEANKREIVTRTFKNYDSGYLGDYMNSGNSIVKHPCFLVPNNAHSTIIVTSPDTSVPLTKYAGITGINIDGDGISILVSFDNKNTWKSLINNVWTDVAIDNIGSKGMTPDIINSIAKSKWAEIFTPTEINFAICLDNLKATKCLNIGSGEMALITAMTNADYTVPAGWGITKIDAYAMSAGYGGAPSYVYQVKVNEETSILLSAIGNSVSNSISVIYPSYESNRVKRIYPRLSSSMGAYGFTRVSLWGAPTFAYLRSISVTLPPNQPPVIQNIALSPSTVHAGGATLTGLIIDKEEDDIQYRISINNQEDLIPWNQLSSSPKEINTIIPVELSPVGTNAITIEASDGDKIATPTTVYLTRTNDNPTITGVLTGDYLQAAIGDPEGDAVKYRILVNGEVRQDWTEFMQPPAIVNYRVSAQDVIINEQNSVIIEVQDNMGGIGNCVFDFVGQYYNIMFMDEYGDYYSDDKGQMLKALDLGSFLIRQSSEVKPVIIKNTTGVLLKDIVISSDPNNDTVIELSLTREGFDRRNSITLPVILGNGDTYTIYIKARTDKEQAIGKNALKLYVTANHA